MEIQISAERQLKTFLDTYRSERGFNPDFALQKKITLLNQYFLLCGLDSAVIGLSGGIDSALSLGLLVAASSQPNSPINKILPIIAPINETGASNQNLARERAILVANHFSVAYKLCDLSKVQQEYVAAFASRESNPWSEGQLLSIVRTPAFYYAAALLQADGFRSVVIGTTNRDEGAYLGFFGKASDAMVDIQPISDLHKSEVYALAEALKIPQEIIEAPPSGDVYDGQTDRQLIGAPYWFVELYLAYLCNPKPQQLSHLSVSSRQTWDQYSQAIEILHAHNAHKYTVGSPSIHLDVYPRLVPGGWNEHTLR